MAYFAESFHLIVYDAILLLFSKSASRCTYFLSEFKWIVQMWELIKRKISIINSRIFCGIYVHETIRKKKHRTFLIIYSDFSISSLFHKFLFTRHLNYSNTVALIATTRRDWFAFSGKVHALSGIINTPLRGLINYPKTNGHQQHR